MAQANTDVNQAQLTHAARAVVEHLAPMPEPREFLAQPLQQADVEGEYPLLPDVAAAAAQSRLPEARGISGIALASARGLTAVPGADGQYYVDDAPVAGPSRICGAAQHNLIEAGGVNTRVEAGGMNTAVPYADGQYVVEPSLAGPSSGAGEFRIRDPAHRKPIETRGANARAEAGSVDIAVPYVQYATGQYDDDDGAPGPSGTSRYGSAPSGTGPSHAGPPDGGYRFRGPANAANTATASPSPVRRGNNTLNGSGQPLRPKPSWAPGDDRRPLSTYKKTDSGESRVKSWLEHALPVEPRHQRTDSLRVHVGIPDPHENGLPPVDFENGKGKGRGRPQANAHARVGVHERRFGNRLEVPASVILGTPAAENGNAKGKGKADFRDSGIGTPSQDDTSTSHDPNSSPSSRDHSRGSHMPYPDGTALTEYNLELLRFHDPALRSYEGYFTPDMTETTGAEWVLCPVKDGIKRRNSNRVGVESDANTSLEAQMPLDEGGNSNAGDVDGDIKDAPGKYPWYTRMFLYPMRMSPPVYENRGPKKNKHKGGPILGW